MRVLRAILIAGWALFAICVAGIKSCWYGTPW
jgi:hypothetical protein